MSTRALIHIKDADNNNKTLVTIYRQMDGYPSGLGKDIEAACGTTKVVNGIQDQGGPCFNGAGCFAAQLISKLKGDTVGSVYIVQPGSKGHCEEFTYTLSVGIYNQITMKVFSGKHRKPMWSGKIQDFDCWLEKYAQC